MTAAVRSGFRQAAILAACARCRAAGLRCRRSARRQSTRRPSARAGNRQAGTATRTRSGPGTRSPPRSAVAARSAAFPAAGDVFQQVRGEDLPLRVGQVAGVTLPRRPPVAYPGHARASSGSGSSHIEIMGPAPGIRAQNTATSEPRRISRASNPIYQTLT